MSSIIAPTPQELINKLSPRQMEIASLLVEGKNASQIATILSISRATVMTHIRIACWKLQIQNRTQLIVMLVRWQVLKELNNDNE